MTRLPPLPRSAWDAEALEPLSGGRPLKPSNALGLLAHHPALAKAFLGFGAHTLARNSLPARTRELAVLRVAWRRRCRYEWAEHVRIARRNGVTGEEIDEVRSGSDTLVNRAVDELDGTDGTSRLSDATYAELAEELDERQLMDLVFTVGAYATLAMAFNTFDVELDPGVPDGGFDVTG